LAKIGSETAGDTGNDMTQDMIMACDDSPTWF